MGHGNPAIHRRLRPKTADVGRRSRPNSVEMILGHGHVTLVMAKFQGRRVANSGPSPLPRPPFMWLNSEADNESESFCTYARSS